MDRELARAELASRADKLRSRGAAAVFIFGSTARGEARNDIDIFIDIAPGRTFSLIGLAGMHAFLSEELGVEVDLTTRESLHPKLRSQIESEAVRIF